MLAAIGTHVLTRLNPLTLFAMTRPGFLVATLVGCALGVAAAATQAGYIHHPLLAAATLLLAVLAHAGANVVNDYFDDLNGADAANTGRIFPFTGGARFIQQHLVTANETLRYGLLLLGIAVIGGSTLALASGPGLLAIGMAGLAIGWSYSAPPLQLMSRGLGEVAVALAWSLIVIGAAFVQQREFTLTPLLCAVSYGLMAANILIVNGLPDAVADAQVGKRTLVVRLGPTGSVLAYGGVTLAAHGWLAIALLSSALPASAAWGMLSLPLSLSATFILWFERHSPQQLTTAIQLTISGALLHGLGQAMGMLYW